MEINIRVLTEELAEGQTVGEYIALKLEGGGVVPPKAERQAKLEEQRDVLAAEDTTLEDDANEAAAEVEAAAVSYGDPTKEPTIPPTTVTPAAEAISAPATQTAAAAVVPAVATAVAGVEVDSAGVPWNAEIHSGNKKMYGKGSGAAKAGRWNWKRGTDETQREEKAQQLAADLRTATPVAAAPVAAAPVVAAPPAVAAPIVAPVVGAVAVPIPENAAAAPAVLAPVAVAPVVAAVAPTVSAGGWTWANFLEAMTASQTGADVILAQAAEYGVTTIPELSPRVDILEAVATALQWPAPVQTA